MCQEVWTPGSPQQRDKVSTVCQGGSDKLSTVCQDGSRGVPGFVSRWREVGCPLQKVKGPWCAQRLEAREPRLLRWQVVWESYDGGLVEESSTFLHADLDLASVVSPQFQKGAVRPHTPHANW